MPTHTDKLAEYRRKRDFERTAEPRGGRAPARRKLAFVVHKHAAGRLHFDLRLELDGVMKSWAVPKGPSLDPAVKRLAIQVEDHPVEYNRFEGTIPEGEYGGGTVMIWDRGAYRPADGGPDPLEALRRGYERGELKFVLEGRRLRGSWVLVRTRSRDPRRPQWLLIKHRDEFAAPGSDVVAEYPTSGATGRTMDEIAAGRPAGRRSARGAVRAPASRTAPRAAPAHATQPKRESGHVARSKRASTADAGRRRRRGRRLRS